MNSVILDELYSNKGKYVTSDVICKKLGVSRIAVWNRVNNLKKMGYKIDAKRGVGYRLKEDGSDILIPYEIKRRLETKILGKQIEYFKLTSSTMDEARFLIEKGCKNGTLVIAEQQTKGRGRNVKKWLTFKDRNIAISVVYKPHNMTSKDAVVLMFAASIAVIEVLKDFGIDVVNIKWPNDIVVGSKKLAGVLLETKSESGILKSAVIGIGINVNMEEFPEDIKDSATSVYKILHQKIDRALMLSNLLCYLENIIHMLESGKRDDIFKMWRRYDITLGKRVKIINNNVSIEGVAKDIDKDGFLMVDVGNMLKKVVTSDSLRILDE